jgi:hypothetical protein
MEKRLYSESSPDIVWKYRTWIKNAFVVMQPRSGGEGVGQKKANERKPREPSEEHYLLLPSSMITKTIKRQR